ncbi:flagellar protein FliT [Thalassobacillus devorans]|uniref:flagellar protein FliT n=1 Tax=Thalassobacillus devorans TaxID=279813 RepID=UPI00048C98A9|nr:flagellar protein FliT [Thalassobacillus devorans]
MGHIAEFHQLTVRLKERLQEPFPSIERQRILDEVTALIDRRGDIIHLVKKPVNEEEKNLLREILSMEVEIQDSLEQNFEDLKKEMRLHKKQGSSTRKYSNPYQSVKSYDGMFLDQKK